MNIELLEEVTTELTVPERASLALGSVKARAELTALVAKSVDIKEIKNKAGRDECHSAAMVLVKARTTIAATGKSARDDATKFSKAVISEEAVLTAITSAEEKRLLALRDAWDEKVAAEKAILEQAIAEQAARIQARIDSLGFNVDLLGSGPAQIRLEIAELSSIEVSLEIFGNRAGEAAQLQANTLMQLEKLHASAVATEAQKAALELQQAKLAAAQKKLDDDQAAAVASRMAEDLRLAGLRAEEERRIAAERAKLDADLAAARKVEQDKLDAEAKLEREASSAAQKVLDDAAAAERQKADDLAAAARKLQAELDSIERAEFERAIAEKQVKAAQDAATASRVCAAAADLLEALGELVIQIDGYQQANGNIGISTADAHAAINKALTGE